MNFLLSLFYELILWVLALLAIPKFIYSFFRHKKYRKSLLARFGFGDPIFKNEHTSSIWIHATSMGETKAIVSVAREIKLLFPNKTLIVSSVTETGHAEAKRSLPFADEHVYLPFDFSWVVNRVIRKTSPQLVILCESDFWYNFLYQAKKKGAALALVNGKVSERSTKRFSKVPFFSKRLFNLLDILCVQNELYQTRFMQAGASEGRIVITGNLKLDDEYPQLTSSEILDWRKKLGIEQSQPVLTIGSMHVKEEQHILPILKDIWSHSPELRVILVPRRPEQFKDIGQLLQKERLQWINFSEINKRSGKEQVILIDTMGLLRMCYQLSDIALVGGSFTDQVGGHNILEPCWYGKPVLFGPHMHTQVELVDLISKYGAGIQVNEGELQEILERWLKNPAESHQIGLRGFQLVKDLKGSTKRTLNALNPLLDRLQST